MGNSLATKLTKEKVTRWHAVFKNNPILGNRCLEVLSRMYSYILEAETGVIKQSPCVGIKHLRETKRFRRATQSEAKRIGEILLRDKDTYPLAVAYLNTLMLTGCRPKDLERIRWSDLETTEVNSEIFGVVRFAGKSTSASGEDEVIIFPPKVLAIINTFSRKASTDLIFNCRAPKDYWAKIRTEMGATDLWMRDLRRTFASAGFSTGIDLNVISECLNHKSTQTTKIYAKLNLEPRIKAVLAISNHISMSHLPTSISK